LVLLRVAAAKALSIISSSIFAFFFIYPLFAAAALVGGEEAPLVLLRVAAAKALSSPLATAARLADAALVERGMHCKCSHVTLPAKCARVTLIYFLLFLVLSSPLHHCIFSPLFARRRCCMEHAAPRRGCAHLPTSLSPSRLTFSPHLFSSPLHHLFYIFLYL
jgi:hypothetical protein